ncbi:Fur family transcriptional regulator [Duganella sp. PWIR1]
MPQPSYNFSDLLLPPATQRVAQWMRKTPLRLTVMRLSVVRVLEGAADPLSAEMVHRLLSEQECAISLATTYRVLKELENSGLVRRDMHVDALGSRSFYAIQLETPQQRDCYLQCDLCGHRHRLSAPSLVDQLVNALTHEGYQPSAELVVVGRCAACREVAAG